MKELNCPVSLLLFQLDPPLLSIEYVTQLIIITLLHNNNFRWWTNNTDSDQLTGII